MRRTTRLLVVSSLCIVGLFAVMPAAQAWALGFYKQNVTVDEPLSATFGMASEGLLWAEATGSSKGFTLYILGPSSCSAHSNHNGYAACAIQDAPAAAEGAYEVRVVPDRKPIAEVRGTLHGDLILTL